MSKLSLEQIKKLSPALLLKIINKAKDYLKHDETMKRVCREYGQTTEIIDLIPIYFDDLDVSAKTSHGVIYLNYQLLTDDNFFKNYSYFIHEINHALQQFFNDKPTQGADEGEYLENPYEVEAFQNQIEFISNEFGEDNAKKYVNKLLDHHEVENPKEKKDLQDTLMDRV